MKTEITVTIYEEGERVEEYHVAAEDQKAIKAVRKFLKKRKRINTEPREPY